MSQNERRRAMKFEIKLKDEEDKLHDLENIGEEEAKNIDLDEIGIGQKQRENTMFGGSNVNKKLAKEFEKSANKRAQMVSPLLSPKNNCPSFRPKNK